MSDVAVDCPEHPSLIALHLRRCKTDQFGKGTHVYINATHNELCPVAALLAYLALRSTDPGPLFRAIDGLALRKPHVVGRVREALSALGYVQSHYAGHSFRIGAATTAAAVGIEDSTIQALGRWSSSAFKAYIKLPRHHLAQLSAQMATATEIPKGQQ